MKRAATWLWVVALLLLFGSYYRHLPADFPNYSPWQDWSKFTDEGWYANGAVQHYLFGRWFQPGDFNAGVALPVWQVMVAAVFHFTGVSLSAARATAITTCIAALAALFFALRTWMEDWAAALVITLLAASEFFYAFLRMAILEPAVLLWFSLLLLAASRARLRGRAGWLWAGALIALMAFTKTTSLCLLPAAMFLVWRRCDGRLWLFLRISWLTAAAAFALAAAYIGVVFATHHQQDFWYLFTSNARPWLTKGSRFDAIWGTVCDGRWADRLFYPAALAVILLGFTFFRRLRDNPIFGCCVLWLACGEIFIAWHANLQPRYYLTLLPAMVTLLVLALQAGIQQRRRVLVAALSLLLIAGFARSLVQIIRWEQHPEYTYTGAADQLAAAMRRQGGRNQLLMSVSSSQLSLMAHLRTINDDFGTDDLDDRLARYDPGWFASWDDPDAGTQQSLEEFYSLHLIGQWPAMDDDDRRVLRLYRLDPLPLRKWHPGEKEEE